MCFSKLYLSRMERIFKLVFKMTRKVRQSFSELLNNIDAY